MCACICQKKGVSAVVARETYNREASTNSFRDRQTEEMTTRIAVSSSGSLSQKESRGATARAFA